MSDRISFEIVNHIATLSTSAKGWTKELNLVSWNGAPAKYDLRDWDPDHDKMGKGITLSAIEMGKLCEAIASLDQDESGDAEEVKAEAQPTPAPEKKPEVEKVEAEPVPNPMGLSPELLAQIEAAKKAMRGE